MTDRPTPEQIADRLGLFPSSVVARHRFLSELARYGYVIVHPDDVPPLTDVDDFHGQTAVDVWNACRAHIFGDDR